MFDLKKIVWGIGKSLWFMWWTDSSFYPLSYSPYSQAQMSRGDYLGLYTGWIYTAVTAIADSVSDLEYQLLANEDSVEGIDHKYMDLITTDLLSSITSFLKLTWEAYIYKYKINWVVQSLEILRPDLLEIKTNWTKVTYSYSYQNQRFNIEREDLIIVKNFSPFDTFWNEARGIWDVQAVAVQAQTDKAIIKWNQNFFQNNASVGWFLTTDQTIEESAAKRIKTSWENSFKGVNNAHKVWVLTSGMKYIENSVSQREMDFVEQRRFNRDEILWIFKVPKAVIWMWEWVNVWNVKAFDIIFAKRTIKPISKQIAEAFNKDLFEWIWFYQFINVVPTDKEELRADLDAGAITINEYRKAIWKPALVWGDVLKIDTTKLSEEMKPVEDIGKKKLCVKSLAPEITKSLLKNIEIKALEESGKDTLFVKEISECLKKVLASKKISKKWTIWDTIENSTLCYTLIAPIIHKRAWKGISSKLSKKSSEEINWFVKYFDKLLGNDKITNDSSSKSIEETVREYFNI